MQQVQDSLKSEALAHSETILALAQANSKNAHQEKAMERARLWFEAAEENAQLALAQVQALLKSEALAHNENKLALAEANSKNTHNKLTMEGARLWHEAAEVDGQLALDLANENVKI